MPFFKNKDAFFYCILFEVPFEKNHWYGYVTITIEDCKMWACARRFWPLSSEGSLSSYTNCNIGTWIFRWHMKDLSVQSLCTTSKLYCRPILTRIMTESTYLWTTWICLKNGCSLGKNCYLDFHAIRIHKTVYLQPLIRIKNELIRFFKIL